MTTRRRITGTLLLAPAALAAAGLARAQAGPRVGSALKLVDLPLLEGGSFQAAKAEGQVVVLYWWASWCPFCAEMSPSIEALWRSQRARGLTVLGLSIDKRAEPALEQRRRKGYTFPSAHYGAHLEKALPYPGKVPALWVRDRKGVVVMTELGQMFPEDVEQIARFV